MSYIARLVLASLSAAEYTRERHPTLFAAQIRAGERTGRDRDCRHLAAAVERYKREKPTVHARPFHDEVEPVTGKWLDDEAREREEHSRGRRLRMNTIELERRRKLTGLALIREVTDHASRITTVAAANIEPSRGGGEGGVPAQQRFDDDPRWQLAERLIHRQAMVMYDLVDEARGYGRSAAVASLSAEEKDEAIESEGRGLTAEETFYRLGPEYGSISYIRKYRRSNGLDGRGHLAVAA